MHSASRETATSTSNVSSVVKPEKSGYDELPKEMHEMKIRENKSEYDGDKVKFNVLFFHIFIYVLCPSISIGRELFLPVRADFILYHAGY